MEPLAEHGDDPSAEVLSPLSARGHGGAWYDEIGFSDDARPGHGGATSSGAPASVPRLSLVEFGGKRVADAYRAKDDGDGSNFDAEEGSDGPHSRDDSATEGDSRPITARSRTSSRDGAASREGSRDSCRTHPDDVLSDGQQLSARSFGFDVRERQPLSARGLGGGGSDAGGSDISVESAPLSARTNSAGELCPRGLPQFSPRFLSPRMGPPSPRGAARGLGAGGFGSARPSPRVHSVTSAGPRSILSPRCGPSALVHSQSDVVQGSGPWGVGGSFMVSPRQRQHKDLDNAARRVAQLEELLDKAQEDNTQLQLRLASVRGGQVKDDDDRGSSGEAAGVNKERVSCANTSADASKSADVEPDGKTGGADGRAEAQADMQVRSQGGGKEDSPEYDQRSADGATHSGDSVHGDTCTENVISAAEKEDGRRAPSGVRGTMDQGHRFARKWEIAAEELHKVRCIGRGAAGAVYEGQWHGGAVAIKQLEVPLDQLRDTDDPVHAEMLLSFRHEVSRMAFLRHPNVVAFFGIVWQPPSLAIVTELALGDLRGFINACSADADGGGAGGVGSLSSLISRVKAGKEACAGLLYLHEQTPPIVHRDVKPENFLVGVDGEIKVCDLGLARDMHQTRMQTEHMGGSSIYIAPEVHQGQHFNTSCDVYAMALVVWELLSLERPFHEFPEHMLPGLVGWGAQRPSVARLLEVAEARKDGPEGAALPVLVRAIQAAWEQDPLVRPSLEEPYSALESGLKILEDGNLLRRQPASCSPSAPGGEQARIMHEVRVMF